jgi:hypothetical protein
MTRARTIPFIVFAVSLMSASIAHAQSVLPDSLFYALQSPPSQFEWGCFGPCECPTMIQAPLIGSFILRRSSIGPLYTNYDVLDVRWKTVSAVQSVSITGSGTYRRGGEVAVSEQLTLDLSFDGGPPQHFDSGLKAPSAPFPVIDTRISLHGEYCHDSVLVVDAPPLGLAAVTDQPTASALSVAPNPFSGSTEIAFALPRAGVVDLAVCDVTGRRVRTLVAHEQFTAGSHVLGWDGRGANGQAVTPGLYLVRLVTPAGRTMRMMAMLR